MVCDLFHEVETYSITHTHIYIYAYIQDFLLVHGINNIYPIYFYIPKCEIN